MQLFWKETILSAAILILTVLALDPFHILMSPSMLVVDILLILFCSVLLGALFIKERPQDEREALHSSISGKVAYLAGIIILAAGAALQKFCSLPVDPWLVGALAAMVIAKAGTAVLQNLRN